MDQARPATACLRMLASDTNSDFLILSLKERLKCETSLYHPLRSIVARGMCFKYTTGGQSKRSKGDVSIVE